MMIRKRVPILTLIHDLPLVIMIVMMMTLVDDRPSKRFAVLMIVPPKVQLLLLPVLIDPLIAYNRFPVFQGSK